MLIVLEMQTATDHVESRGDSCGSLLSLDGDSRGGICSEFRFSPDFYLFIFL